MFLMVGGYSAFQTNLNINAKGNIVEKSRVIQNWTSTSQEDFHTDYYRENIVTATFLDNNNVPDNATESWNVSEDKNNKGGVMAWVIPNNEDSTKYDLYIGANKGVIANEDSSYLFYDFRKLTNIDFKENFDTNNAINMRYMFSSCVGLINLDLSSFDTSNVTTMENMFSMYNNSFLNNNLVSINFGQKFITSNVVNMKSMFAGLQKIKLLDLSNFDTSKVTTMFHMFTHCQELVNLNLNNFNTSNVTNMTEMFAFCSSIVSIDMNNFNTSKVTDMSNMFYGNKSITELNLCSFNTNNVTNMTSMFEGTSNITGIYVGPNWTTANADTTNMFQGSRLSSVTTGQC